MLNDNADNFVICEIYIDSRKISHQCNYKVDFRVNESQYIASSVVSGRSKKFKSSILQAFKFSRTLEISLLNQGITTFFFYSIFSCFGFE